MKFTSIHNKTKEYMMNMKQQYIEMSGKSFDRFVKKNDIYGLIKNNPEIAVAGLVPIIDGKERYDLAFTNYFIIMYEVEDYCDPNNVQSVKIGDDLRELAHLYLASHDFCTMDSFYDYLVDEFKDGGTFHTFSYTAKTKTGRLWRNTILCANKR
mgnify:FL=1